MTHASHKPKSSCEKQDFRFLSKSIKHFFFAVGQMMLLQYLYIQCSYSTGGTLSVAANAVHGASAWALLIFNADMLL